MKNDTIKLSSVAEDLFIDIFIDVFGPENSNYLFIQYPVMDIYGGNRYIDFALECGNQKIAIEIDGETYHNPNKVSQNKYYDDLLKQNSLIYNNWKVYRWPYNQLKNQRERVKDELKTYLGELPIFKEIQDYLPTQRGKIIELKEHQENAIENLEDMRKKGESIALLYHATGTGKTVTAVTDAKRLGKRTLFIAHTKELVNQAKETFDNLWGDVDTGLYIGEKKEKDSYVICGSIQSISQNLDKFKPDEFEYIIIDEAHHGAAETYKKVLGHFNPEFTLGLTATPEREDGEDILELFKNVAHRLDLETAVKIGELVPIRCIRVKTNIDISNVRINGIKYNSQDLESKLFIPERNKVILDTYIEFVKDKKIVIFCASVKHAEEIAELFKNSGIKAEAVSGTTKKAKRDRILQEYENGDINVLCACDLLNEGWDSPKTQVLFMARPTMSKTIYLQQLGRGTRKSEGKDCLLVFDFIDNANLFNMPLSLHRLLNFDKYRPGEYILAPDGLKKFDNDLFMRGEKPEALIDFPINVMDYEPIELFNWQEKVKNLISQMEFVRMVDVQSETIERYIREGLIIPDLEIPMGSRSFKYFKQETIENYAKQFSWQLITPANMKDKFIEFVKKMDMSYSFKPVLLKAMLKYADNEGKVCVDDIVNYFIDFYENRKKKGLKPEKPNSLYSRESYTEKEVGRNIFQNPFRRFEDMRFVERCRDVEYVEFNRYIWRRLEEKEKEWIVGWCDGKLEEYFKRIV